MKNATCWTEIFYEKLNKEIDEYCDYFDIENVIGHTTHHKILWDFFIISLVSLNLKWNGTSLLPPLVRIV